MGCFIWWNRERPDVVFLQEVIPETFSYIEEKLPEYMCIAGNTSDYFTATLLRRFTVYHDSHTVTEHSGSVMMRNLLTVEVMLVMNLLIGQHFVCLVHRHCHWILDWCVNTSALYWMFQQELYNAIPNVAVWRVLRKHLRLKAYKLSTVQHTLNEWTSENHLNCNYPR
jgi:hypothetical protein